MLRIYPFKKKPGHLQKYWLTPKWDWRNKTARKLEALSKKYNTDDDKLCGSQFTLMLWIDLSFLTSNSYLIKPFIL